jgi:hypothetical protein
MLCNGLSCSINLSNETWEKIGQHEAELNLYKRGGDSDFPFLRFFSFSIFTMSHEHQIQKALNVLVYAFLITASVLSFSGNDSLEDIFNSFET